MKLFFINAEFIIPAIFTLFIPVLLMGYYFMKDWKRSFNIAIYTSLLFVTIFSLATFSSTLESFLVGMEGVMHAIIVSLVAGLSTYVALKWLNMKSNKFVYYVTAAVLIVGIMLPYITTSIPLMSFV